MRGRHHMRRAFKRGFHKGMRHARRRFGRGRRRGLRLRIGHRM